MRLRLVERKKNSLNEADEQSTIAVSMRPGDFLRLTTYGDSYRMIENFATDREKIQEAISQDKINDRKKIILGRKTIPKTMSESDTLAVNLLLGGLNFLSPSKDASSWGQYDPEKSGALSLSITVQGDEGKVVNHEGRNRSVYLMMKGEQTVNVNLFFINKTLKLVDDIPNTFIPQFTSNYKVFKQNIKSAKGDNSNFKTVEGFMHFWNDKRYNKGDVSIDDFIKKWNDENLVEVAGEEAIIFKAQEVNPPGSPYPLAGINTFFLYSKDVLNVPVRKDQVEYYKEVANYKLPLAKGPVTVKSK